MEILSYSFTRQHFAEVMDRVNEDCTPVLVTRQKGKSIIMISLDDFNALEETAYLLRSPENAKRLNASIDRLRSQGGQMRELVNDD